MSIGDLPADKGGQLASFRDSAFRLVSESKRPAGLGEANAGNESGNTLIVFGQSVSRRDERVPRLAEPSKRKQRLPAHDPECGNDATVRIRKGGDTSVDQSQRARGVATRQQE